jgi:hypothetical protein
MVRTSFEKGAGVMLFRGEGDLTLQEIVRAVASYFEPLMGRIWDFREASALLIFR